MKTEHESLTVQESRFQYLEEKVIKWAEDKGILQKATRMKQGIKTLEEVNELLAAIHDNNEPEIIDALGDILVTIIIQAEMNGLKLTDCLESAYNVIAKRSGKMINGEFKKD
jgi:NTP pyrophosphatase (non-canonical NTP hydrolase)